MEDRKRALGTWRGRKVGPAKATVREERTEDGREGKVPERQGRATMTISDSEKPGESPESSGWQNARGRQAVSSSSRQGGVSAPSLKTLMEPGVWRGACAPPLG